MAVAAGFTIPVGTIMAFGGDVGDPEIAAALAAEGWLPCLGTPLSKSDSKYATLYGLIGYRYGGEGDTFNLPDLRGVFVRGATGDTSTGLKSVVGTLLPATTKRPDRTVITEVGGSHTHWVPNLPTRPHTTYYVAGPSVADWSGDNTQTDSAGSHSHLISDGGDDETRPLNLYLDYIIKAWQTP